MASDNTAKVCSRTMSSTKMVVNARKPGTSRRLCRMPISTPVKAARSTTKLLSSADQALKATGMATDMRMSSMSGLRQPPFNVVEPVAGRSANPVRSS